MVATTMTMAFGDALVKSLSSEFSVWQIFVARSLIAIPLIMALLRVRGPSASRSPVSWFWPLVRSALLIAMWIAFYAALAELSLPVVAAAYYTGPLFIALFSAWIIGEPVGARRWFAILLGFVGVVIILRPGTQAFSWLALLPIASAIFYALAAIVTRAKCARDSSLSLSLALNVFFLGAGVLGTMAITILTSAALVPGSHAFLLGPWLPMGAREWGLMALMAVLIVAISTGVARAYQSGPPTIIATFDYSYLIFAGIWSFVFFADIPDLATLAGMILIGAAGCVAMASPGTRKTSPAIDHAT
ncbi:MAG: DMT family transporter [Alphaproteobacteria bacterium]